MKDLFSVGKVSLKRERNWIVLAEDGRHVTLGRHTNPTSDEIDRSGAALQATGLGGWLAVLEGQYYRRDDDLTLIMVREISSQRRTTWEQAEDAFKRIRNTALNES